jgi:hypothetical protein
MLVRHEDGEDAMKIYIDRDICTGTLPFCVRCFAFLAEHPMGVDRPCITQIIPNNGETVTFVIRTEGETVTLTLDPATRERVITEGWDALVPFVPSFFRA